MRQLQYPQVNDSNCRTPYVKMQTCLNLLLYISMNAASYYPLLK